MIVNETDWNELLAEKSEVRAETLDDTKDLRNTRSFCTDPASGYVQGTDKMIQDGHGWG